MIKIQQAVFGPLRGHGFLAGSRASDEALFRNAAWATDLPQTAPPGVAWKAFFRIVRVDDHLVLVHTKPFGGSSRAGMVISRAAFIPVVDADRLSDLRPFARSLEDAWAQGDPLEPICVEDAESAQDLAHPGPLALLVATGLTQRPQRPIVVPGQDDFDDAMFELWLHVPAELRPQLTFSLSFGPEDARNASILCAPEELLGKWEASHRIDRSAQVVVSQKTAVLLGLNSGEQVKAYARDIGFVLDSPAAIGLALTAYQLRQGGIDTADSIQLLRILSERAGSGPKVADIKADAISRLVALVEEWSVQDVMAMRNLDVADFRNAAELSSAVIAWTESIQRRADAHGVSTILQSWMDGRPKPMWMAAVGQGLVAAYGTSNTSGMLFTAVWEALAAARSRSNSVLDLLIATRAPEVRLIETMPAELDVAVGDVLVLEFVERRWWELTGQVLAATRTPLEALIEALTLGASDDAKTVLISAALARGTDQQTLDAALRTSDPTAIQVAASACVRTPSMLKAFDWCNSVWYQILESALKADQALLLSLPNAESGVDKVLHAQISATAVWEVIARTPLANLTAATARAHAWSLIPGRYLTAILTATANGWLTSFEAGQRIPKELEPELASAVREDVASRGFLARVLRRAPAAFSLYLREFGIASESDATFLLSDLHQSQIQLSESSARDLGRLIGEKRWVGAANRAAEMLRERDDIRPLLAECFTILGLIDKIWIGFQLGRDVHLSTDEAWSAFESEASTMYPWGPGDRDLWSRSGGRNKDLSRGDTGTDAWHRCIRELRAGKSPGVHALISEMCNDYQHNDTLKVLLNHRFGN